VAEAIEVIRDQWSDLAENGVTDAELEAAQRYLTGAYPLRFDGNGRIAGILAGCRPMACRWTTSPRATTV
jgi:zinc protease